MEEGYWFTSNLFKISKGEDEETNPGCYGRAVAEWLCTKFYDLGYKAEVIPEDWGWCVMCKNEEYLLWVGCGPMQKEEFFENYDENDPPKGEDIVWHVFSTIEIPFFMLKSIIHRWTGKLDLDVPITKLQAELEQVLTSEKGIVFCEEPQI